MAEAEGDHGDECDERGEPEGLDHVERKLEVRRPGP